MRAIPLSDRMLYFLRTNRCSSIDQGTPPMNWRFLKQIVELVPGERAAAMAVTDFPKSFWRIISQASPSLPASC